MGLRLRDLKVPKAELEALARQSLVLPDFKNHPRLATLADVRAILDRSH
jgi:alcohol dehydrogenase class IV